MKINVKGTGTEYYFPNQITLNINFQTKSNSYDEVLIKGATNVQEFIQKVLIPLGLTKEELKTRNIIVSKEKKYNEQTHQYEFDGYFYNQTAKLDFDYDKEKIIQTNCQNIEIKQFTFLSNKLRNKK